MFCFFQFKYLKLFTFKKCDIQEEFDFHHPISLATVFLTFVFCGSSIHFKSDCLRGFLPLLYPSDSFRSADECRSQLEIYTNCCLIDAIRSLSLIEISEVWISFCDILHFFRFQRPFNLNLDGRSNKIIMKWRPFCNDGIRFS